MVSVAAVSLACTHCSLPSCVLGEQEEEEHGWVEEPVYQDYMIGDLGEVGEYQEDHHLASPGEL